MSKIFIGYNKEDEAKERRYYEELEKCEEEWRRVYFYGKKYNYEVSNHGRLRNRSTGKIVKLHETQQGYFQVELWDHSDVKRTGIHRLVAMMFIKIPAKYSNMDIHDLQINHIDGVKSHNMPYNLEWCTGEENMLHSWKTGLRENCYGEKHGSATITNDDVLMVCKYISEGYSSSRVSELTGVSFDIVHNIRNGKSWKWISKDYKFKPSIDSIPFKIDDETFHKICKDIEDNDLTNKEIAKKYGVSHAYIPQIRNGNVRPEISSQYDFKKNAYKKLAKKDNDDLIHLICSNLQHGVKPTEIRKKYPQYKLSLSFISEIKHGKLRKDISNLYDFS